ncbi:hypothetical protein RR46_01055 [Papilio xuthus]|uniref:Uncharacterized protein n=1 Tax=Papilio xuthus TaxID=66420 RepID=A0A0N0PAC0_PAPXU|nr:hypothetical protein RR46_01055 [Papilio xuthus]
MEKKGNLFTVHTCSEPGSARLSAEDIVSVANGGAVTPSGALRHYLAPPLAPPPPPATPPAALAPPLSLSARSLRHAPCDCLPQHPIPPPELFHF